MIFLSMAFSTATDSNPAETPAGLQDFVVLGQEGVLVKQDSVIVSGDVGANIASAGPFLADGAEAVIGLGVTFRDPASRVMGDSIRVRMGATVYDVYSNDLNGLGQILGTRVSPISLPLVPSLPPVPSFVPGTQNVTAPLNSAFRLNAGNYGSLLARNGSTVTFAGGVYNFQAWDVRSAAKLYFEAPTQIRIKGRLSTDLNTFIGPAPTAAGLDATGIVIIITGINGDIGAVDALPKTVEFGVQNSIAATVYAPNGTLWMKEGSTAIGAFLGRWVVIGEQVRLTRASAVDHTPPTITASVAPPPNAAGWHHQDVTVSFTCNDAGSGIAQCPAPVVISLEGAGQIVTGTATDRAGNSASVSINLNIDKTPPNISITSPPTGTVSNLSPALIAGTSTDTLSGIADLLCVGTDAAQTGSTFTCQRPLTEGTNVIVVQAVDRAGNTASSSITMTLDTIPPIVTITSPANGIRVTADAVTLSGLVDDPSAAVSVNDLAVPVAPDGAWMIGGVPLREGDNVIQVIANDLAGNHSQGQVTIYRESAALALTLCARPFQEERPQPPIDGCDNLAVASYMGFGSTVGLVAGLVDQRAESLTLNGVEFPDGTEIMETGPVRDGLREGTFFWAYVNIPQAAGNHPVTAAATGGGQQQSATVNFSPALIFCAEPFREQTPQPPLQECATQALGAYTGFVAGLLDESEVSVSIDGVELPDGIEISNDPPIYNGMREGNFFWAVVKIPQIDGLNPFTAVAADAEGEERESTVSFLRDTVPPRLTITSPPDRSFVNGPSAVITGIVDDPEAIVRFDFFGPVVPVDNGVFQLTAALPIEGTNTLTISATDPSGNLATARRQIIRDTVPPSVTIAAPQVGSAVATPTVTIQGTVIDQNAVTATITLNAGPSQPLALSAGAYGSPATLNEGMNQIVVRAIDAAGNIGTTAGNIMLDTTPPVIGVTAPLAGAQLNGVVAVTAEASDLPSGISRVDLLVNGVSLASRSTPPYDFSLNTATVPAGDATVTVRAIDMVGNTTEASRVVHILGGQIAFQITSPADGDTITQGPYLIRGILKKNDSEPITEEVGITVNGYSAQFQGTTFGLDGISLEPGTQTLTATATDNNGLLATASIGVTVAPGELDIPPLSLHASVTCAPAPLQVTFTSDETLPHPVVLYELDVDGDGAADVEGPTLAEVSHVYTDAGLYFPTIRATDSNGNTFTATTMVNVINRSVIDGFLQGRWASMVGALNNGNTATALDQIAAESRSRYETMFNLLQNQLPSIMSTAREFNFMSIGCETATYELVTSESGGTYSYEVVFSKDANGLWKILGF